MALRPRIAPGLPLATAPLTLPSTISEESLRVYAPKVPYFAAFPAFHSCIQACRASSLLNAQLSLSFRGYRNLYGRRKNLCFLMEAEAPIHHVVTELEAVREHSGETRNHEKAF